MTSKSKQIKKIPICIFFVKKKSREHFSRFFLKTYLRRSINAMNLAECFYQNFKKAKNWERHSGSGGVGKFFVFFCNFLKK